MHNKIDSISAMHEVLGLPKPSHPMISILDSTEGNIDMRRLPPNYVTSFYKITFITKLGGKIRYGQGYYDFNEGSMVFAAPGQVMGPTDDYKDNGGYALIFHPDFLLGHPLAARIRQYGFFSYDTNEALHLSDQEKQTILTIYHHIQHEIVNRIDDVSQDLLLVQIEMLLTYGYRFYKRQFITRKPVSHDLLTRVEALLEQYFSDDELLQNGIPTVQYLAGHLNYSPNYLSDMLRSLTGQSAQQHIHNKLIEKAKEKLSTSGLSISEIAYALGFEHPQSFTKLFKARMNVSPLQFRQSFN